MVPAGRSAGPNPSLVTQASCGSPREKSLFRRTASASGPRRFRGLSFREQTDPRFDAAIRRLARRGATPAETVRRLRRMAARLDLPRPSYEHVRRIVNEERRLHANRVRERDRKIAALLAGRVKV